MAVTKISPKVAVFNESKTMSEFRDKRILHFNIRVPNSLNLDELAARWLRTEWGTPDSARNLDLPNLVLRFSGWIRGLGRRNGLCAMSTAPGCDGNVAQAFGTLLGRGRWRRSGVARLDALQHPADGEHNAEIYDARDDRERDYMVEKVANLEFPFSDVEDDVTQVRLSDGRRNQRVEDVTDECGHDTRECRADNHRHCQVHHVAAQNKIAKAFEHWATS